MAWAQLLPPEGVSGGQHIAIQSRKMSKKECIMQQCNMRNNFQICVRDKKSGCGNVCISIGSVK